jgi:hypothetical protein
MNCMFKGKGNRQVLEAVRKELMGDKETFQDPGRYSGNMG